MVSIEKAAQWVQVSEKYSLTVTFASGFPTKRSARVSSSAQAGVTARAGTAVSRKRRDKRMETSLRIVGLASAMFSAPDHHPSQRRKRRAERTVGQIGDGSLGLRHRFRH